MELITFILWIIIIIVGASIIFFDVIPMFSKPRTWIENSDARGQSVLTINSLGHVKQGRVLGGIDLGDTCILRLDFHGNIEEISGINPFYLKPVNPFQAVCGQDPPLYAYEEHLKLKEDEIKREVFSEIDPLLENIKSAIGDDKILVELRNVFNDKLTFFIRDNLSKSEDIEKLEGKVKKLTEEQRELKDQIVRLEEKNKTLEADLREYTATILKASRPPKYQAKF